ncbi:MAG: hypothetical protein K5751_06670 [Treponemataceae bacterium]|nr:hypothetical protein [Treponemataceae bacterium]
MVSVSVQILPSASGIENDVALAMPVTSPETSGVVAVTEYLVSEKDAEGKAARLFPDSAYGFWT